MYVRRIRSRSKKQEARNPTYIYIPADPLITVRHCHVANRHTSPSCQKKKNTRAHFASFIPRADLVFLLCASEVVLDVEHLANFLRKFILDHVRDGFAPARQKRLGIRIFRRLPVFFSLLFFIAHCQFFSFAAEENNHHEG